MFPRQRDMSAPRLPVLYHLKVTSVTVRRRRQRTERDTQSFAAAGVCVITANGNLVNLKSLLEFSPNITCPSQPARIYPARFIPSQEKGQSSCKSESSVSGVQESWIQPARRSPDKTSEWNYLAGVLLRLECWHYHSSVCELIEYRAGYHDMPSHTAPITAWLKFHPGPRIYRQNAGGLLGHSSFIHSRLLYYWTIPLEVILSMLYTIKTDKQPCTWTSPALK